MFRGFETEGVAVNFGRGSRHARVVLVRLNEREVFSLAFSKAVMTVELKFDSASGLGRSRAVFAHPDKFFARVVEVEADFVGASGEGVFAVELDLLNEVFVADLREATAFVSVKVDVIDVEFGVGEGRGAELNVEFDFVVLKGNEGKGETRVAAEPELKRNVEGFGGGTGGGGGHRGVRRNFAFFLSEFVPDFHPFTSVFVNTLATNFDFDVVNKVFDRDGGRTGRVIDGKLKVAAVDQVTVARNRASDFASGLRVAVEGLFDRFHREVRVATVHHFEERDLRVASQVNVVGAVSYKLH